MSLSTILDSAAHYQFLRKWNPKIASTQTQAIADAMTDAEQRVDSTTVESVKKKTPLKLKAGATNSKLKRIMDGMEVVTDSNRSLTERCTSGADLKPTIAKWEAKAAQQKANPSDRRKKKALIVETVKKQIEVNERLRVAKQGGLSPSDVASKVLETQAHAREVDAQLCLIGGKIKKPEVGMSKSFLIGGADGKNTKGEYRYIHKVQAGEGQLPGWPEGGGLPREVVMSHFNELSKRTIGIDFGCPRATTAVLDAPEFDVKGDGKTEQIGALVEFVKSRGNGDEVLKQFPDSDAFLAAIPDADIQKTALLDFIMINGDRNGGNMLFKDAPNGALSMVPIDAGNAMPPAKTLGKSVSCMIMEVDKAGGHFNAAGLMQRHPAIDRTFDAATLAKIQAMNPQEVTQYLKDARTTLPAPAQAPLADDSVELVGKSVSFLKDVVALSPQGGPRVRDVQNMYAQAFIRYAYGDFKDPRNPADAVAEKAARDAYLTHALAQSSATTNDVIAQETAWKQFSQIKNARQQFNDLGYQVGESFPGKYVEQMNILNNRIESPAALQKLATLLAGAGLTEAQLANGVPNYRGAPVGVRLPLASDFVAAQKVKQIPNQAKLTQDALAWKAVEVRLPADPTQLAALGPAAKVELLEAVQALDAAGGMPLYRQMQAAGVATTGNCEEVVKSLHEYATQQKDGTDRKIAAAIQAIAPTGLRTDTDWSNPNAVKPEAKAKFLKAFDEWKAAGGTNEFLKLTTAKPPLVTLRTRDRWETAVYVLTQFDEKRRAVAHNGGDNGVTQVLNQLAAWHLPSKTITPQNLATASAADKADLFTNHDRFLNNLGGINKYREGVALKMFPAATDFETAFEAMKDNEDYFPIAVPPPPANPQAPGGAPPQGGPQTTAGPQPQVGTQTTAGAQPQVPPQAPGGAPPPGGTPPQAPGGAPPPGGTQTTAGAQPQVPPQAPGGAPPQAPGGAPPPGGTPPQAPGGAPPPGGQGPGAPTRPGAPPPAGNPPGGQPAPQGWTGARPRRDRDVDNDNA